MCDNKAKRKINILRKKEENLGAVNLYIRLKFIKGTVFVVSNKRGILFSTLCSFFGVLQFLFILYFYLHDLTLRYLYEITKVYLKINKIIYTNI